MKTIEIKGKEVTIEMSIGWTGYGQYRISADVKTENNKYNIGFHSTDSELYDKRKDDEINYEDYQEMLYNKVERALIEEIEAKLQEEN